MPSISMALCIDHVFLFFIFHIWIDDILWSKNVTTCSLFSNTWKIDIRMRLYFIFITVYVCIPYISIYFLHGFLIKKAHRYVLSYFFLIKLCQSIWHKLFFIIFLRFWNKRWHLGKCYGLSVYDVFWSYCNYFPMQ